MDTISCHKTRSSNLRLLYRRTFLESSRVKKCWNGSGTTSQRSPEIIRVLNAGVSRGESWTSALLTASKATRKEWALHEVLLAGWGMPIGELFDLEELASHCKESDRWSFFVTSEVCNVPGGVAR